MAYTTRMYPKGSWILKIVILILAVVLVVSVLYPQKLWKKHDVLTIDCQERMENLNTVSQQYHRVTGEYNSDLDSLISFFANDSVEVKAGVYEFEKLSLYDAPYDSFLVGFVDQFHFERIEVVAYKDSVELTNYTDTESGEADSIVLSMIPKDRYVSVIEPVRVGLKAEKGVKYYFRGKGEKDRYWIIYSRGMINRTNMPYEVKLVPAEDYLLYRDLADISVDPITGERFEVIMNKRFALDAALNFKRVKRGEPDPALTDNELYENLFVNQMARKARARLDQDLQKDSTLFGQQLELQSDYFEAELELLRPGRQVKLDASLDKMTPADSVENFRNEELIRDLLFSTRYDSLIRVWYEWDLTKEILADMTYEENIGISDEKIVGVTIRPPFGESYSLPTSDVLAKLFSVGNIVNPGFVENNDLSWCETK